MRILFFLLVIITNSLFAQQSTIKLQREVIGSLGSSSKNLSVRIQSTVGQASSVTSESYSNYLHITQGFHRAFIKQYKFDDWTISLYPNPNNGHFWFFTSLPETENFRYQLFDIQGRILLNGFGSGSDQIEVNVQAVVDGMYILKVHSKYTSSTFKIDIFQ